MEEKIVQLNVEPTFSKENKLMADIEELLFDADMSNAETLGILELIKFKVVMVGLDD